METTEIWADVKGYEGLYQVSNHGNFKSLRTGKTIAVNPNKVTGYVRVQLSKDGKSKNVPAHRLVLIAFVGGTGPEVNHKNGCKSDNRVENLEWSNRSHNMKHACYDLGHFIRPVVAIGVDGSIREYRSVCEAARDGFKYSNIYSCLSKQNQTHKGYYWRRPDESPSEQLISAAPDLLSALKLLLADVKDYDAWQRPCHAVDVAEAAISKAEGR